MTDRHSVEDDFREFVAARSPALLRTAYLLTGDWATAEDLLQTALTKMYLAWRRLGEIEAVEPYARRVLVNTVDQLVAAALARRAPDRGAARAGRRRQGRRAARTRRAVAACAVAARTAARGAGAALLRRPVRGADRRDPRHLDRHGEEPDLPGPQHAARPARRRARRRRRPASTCWPRRRPTRPGSRARRRHRRAPGARPCPSHSRAGGRSGGALMLEETLRDAFHDQADLTPAGTDRADRIIRRTNRTRRWRRACTSLAALLAFAFLLGGVAGWQLLRSPRTGYDSSVLAADPTALPQPVTTASISPHDVASLGLDLRIGDLLWTTEGRRLDLGGSRRRGPGLPRAGRLALQQRERRRLPPARRRPTGADRAGGQPLVRQRRRPAGRRGDRRAADHGRPDPRGRTAPRRHQRAGRHRSGRPARRQGVGHRQRGQRPGVRVRGSRRRLRRRSRLRQPGLEPGRLRCVRHPQRRRGRARLDGRRKAALPRRVARRRAGHVGHDDQGLRLRVDLARASHTACPPTVAGWPNRRATTCGCSASTTRWSAIRRPRCARRPAYARRSGSTAAPSWRRTTTGWSVARPTARASCSRCRPRPATAGTSCPGWARRRARPWCAGRVHVLNPGSVCRDGQPH